MKVTLKEEQKEFKPLELNIVLETQQEVNALYAIVNCRDEELATLVNRTTTNDTTQNEVEKVARPIYNELKHKQTLNN